MNRLTKCPCQFCEKRTITCHSNCEDYKEYRKQVDKATTRERILRSSYGEIEHKKGEH